MSTYKILKRSVSAVAATAALSLLLPISTANAGTSNYIGELIPGGYNFCPRGSAPADGRLVAINQNTALFSIYGTFYGGDGRTTFAYPDLRGRAPISDGRGPGLQDYRIGAKGGTETFSVPLSMLPSHNHTTRDHFHRIAPHMHSGTIVASSGTVNDATPSASTTMGTQTRDSFSPDASTVNMAAGTVTIDAIPGEFTAPPDAGASGSTGRGAGGNTRDPYQAITWCVVETGIFPSRS